jgi:hypothetical protein
MTTAVQTPTETPLASSARPALSPMVVRPMTYRDTLRTLLMLFAISAASVFAAVIAWRWFLVSPPPGDPFERDSIAAHRGAHAARQLPPRFELEVTVQEIRPVATGPEPATSAQARLLPAAKPPAAPASPHRPPVRRP